MGNEDTLNLEDDYISGDELLDEDLNLDREEPLVEPVPPQNKSKGKRKRSKCWRTFEIVGDMLEDGTNNIECTKCGHVYCLNLRRSGTTTLLRHMEQCSKTRNTPSCGNRKLDMMVFREMIGLAIIEHDLPFSFVEYRRVREAFMYANSNIEFWSRNTAAADCLKIYEKEKLKLKKSLDEIPGRFCFTTDLWRSLTIEGYMCLTAHYIDSEWKLKTKILSFCAFPPPHTGAGIATKVLALLKEWGLEKRVFTITVDNASSNDNMQGILKKQLRKSLVCNGEFFHIRCVAHILNLIVQKGLEVIDAALEKIRDSVKFVKVSESREQSFQTCVETVGIESKAGLILDVPTRWNSTHLMLERAIMYKEAFRHLAEVDTSYKFLPSDVEWSRAELIFELLTPFAVMTNLISGSSYPTANLYFNQVWQIEMWLRNHQDSDDDDIYMMVKGMQEKFDKYWHEYNDILAVAAVFDPRMKFTFLRYCFNSLDATTSESKIDHVHKKLKKLFDVYKKNTKKPVAGTSKANTVEQDILPGYNVSFLFLMCILCLLNQKF